MSVPNVETVRIIQGGALGCGEQLHTASSGQHSRWRTEQRRKSGKVEQALGVQAAMPVRFHSLTHRLSDPYGLTFRFEATPVPSPA